MNATGRKRPRPRYRPGFWVRPEVRRRYLPVAIGVLAMILLALTFAVAPRGRRRQTAPPAAGAAEPEPAAISEERVELRRDPDSRSEAIIALGRGSGVTVEEQRGTWCRVRDRSGREGWLPRHSVER
ncbi:MAG TPA: SH3 domain-containing protein, partial [Thermoanaerobaculia bacterium]|nr:SH3 domain-containing protein [Thermoanaerobaculia bacterium]